MANHRLSAAHRRVHHQTKRQHEIAADVARRLARIRNEAALQRQLDTHFPTT